MLRTLLADRHVACEFSSDLGAGLDLANLPLDDFDFAIAILPTGISAAGGGSAAILIEIGVCAAKKIPLFTIASPDEPLSAALGTLMTVRASLENTEALKLHLDVFLRRLDRSTHRSNTNIIENPAALGKDRAILPTQKDAIKRARDLLRESAQGDIRNPAVFEANIILLLEAYLAANGAVTQHRLNDTRGDQGIDLAFAHPSIPEAVLVEVKQNLARPALLEKAQEQLSHFVQRNGGAIGLLLIPDYIGAHLLHQSTPSPLVRTLGFGEFIRETDKGGLGDFLRQTRNRMVHGL